MTQRLTPAYEDYIEAIYELCQQGGGQCRSVDVAERLGFSKASVTRATKNLREAGLINQERYGHISLTDAGSEYGHAVLTRHKTLQVFLHEILGVDEKTANEEACKIEHTVSKETMERWTAWIKTCKKCPSRNAEQ